MQITRYGHSCLLVEDADARILIDPGNLSTDFESLTGLSGILVTHVHDDHIDAERIAALVAANPQAAVIAEAAAAEKIRGAGVEQVTAAQAGDSFDLGSTVEVFGKDHAVIHADLPGFGNVGYLVGDRLFHPGDSLEPPATTVEILATPVQAPWMALKEAIDYVRAVAPQAALPIHDGLLKSTGLYTGRLASMGPEGMRWLDLAADGSAEL